jgi:DNA-binding NtrC family response regulator
MSDFDEAIHTLTAVRPRSASLGCASLQVLGRGDGERLDFEGSARIGAKPIADLVLGDPKVSSLHCEVDATRGLRVRDLGSKNGTWVGTVRILDALLAPGDVITVGDTRIRVSPAAAPVELALHEQDDFFGLVGASSALRALTARLARLAATDTTVLLHGETGTGKERAAAALHLAGPRAQGPLVTVDCGSLAASLIEAELFGHERGAFTGAVRSVAGAFERARGGTLFLDEIGELPLDLQPKLLRAIEARTVRRLGGTETISIDARIVAATHRDLGLRVASGHFREDLYYRLAVLRLTLPPLRERLEDLPLLAGHLLRELGADPARVLDGPVLAALARHDWPGNVRELRNTLERAVALAEPIRLEALPSSSAAPAATIDLSVPLRLGRNRVSEAYERAYVSALLLACGGNHSEAARQAGIDRISLYRLLDRLGLRDR